MREKGDIIQLKEKSRVEALVQNITPYLKSIKNIEI